MRMKYIAAFLLAFSLWNGLYAQEVLYWTGESAHPDPIMRHHEAFMDAFMQYIRHQQEAKSASAEKYVSDTSLAENAGQDNSSSTFIMSSDSCRIETVSSVTCKGRETLVISTGSGEWAYYNSLQKKSYTRDTLHIDTLLEIITVR